MCKMNLKYITPDGEEVELNYNNVSYTPCYNFSEFSVIMNDRHDLEWNDIAEASITIENIEYVHYYPKCRIIYNNMEDSTDNTPVVLRVRYGTTS